MASLRVAYAKDIHGKYQAYWPSWMPTRPISVGDCGTLERGIFFEPKRPASKFGVSREALKTRRVKQQSMLDFVSKRGVKVELQVDGANTVIPGIPTGRAGGRITFSRANATVMAAVGTREREIVDKYLLEQELAELVKRGVFPPDYVVVTDVIAAKSARVFISTGKGQSVTVHATATATTGPFELASLGGVGTAAMSTEALMAFAGLEGMTPLFKLMGFSVGGKIRHWRRTHLSRSRHVPRIIVEPLRVQPTVGRTIMVKPIDGQGLAVAPIDQQAFVVEAGTFGSLRVDPVMVDREALGAIAPRIGVGRRSEALLGGQEGVLLGALNQKPEVGETAVLRPFEGSTVLIQPIDDDPFLVKLARGQAVSFQPAALEFPNIPELAAGVESLDQEALSLEYVDFDAELAAAGDAAG